MKLGSGRLAAYLLIVLLAAAPVSAAEYHMKLLAVSQGDQIQGSVADLYLRVEPGSGRVFLETFPLSRLDTQISTRFAKEIACNQLDVECGKYDFYYTIKANSAIIAGPSAGAAIAVLTASALNGTLIDEELTITGTINSGGLIGPVGGLPEKIEAAAAGKVKKVLIPKGERFVNQGSQIVDMFYYGRQRGVEVAEVADLNEAFLAFTGSEISSQENFEISPYYTTVMSGLAKGLCDSSAQLKAELGANSTADELAEKAVAAMNNSEYYSAASFCFGANVRYRYDILRKGNASPESLKQQAETLGQEMNAFRESLPKYATITDLQTYSIVQERLQEAEDALNTTFESLQNKDLSYSNYAFAAERFSSAKAWASFFGKPGREFKFDEQLLRETCLSKIYEAQERLEYVRLFFPSALEESSVDIGRAMEDLEERNYELCVSRASRSKAEADVILTLMGVDEKQIEPMLDKKLEAIRRSLAKATSKGVFPIVGYSYYEYANSLRKDDLDSALLYAEYALELSNFDTYFEQPLVKERPETVAADARMLLLAILGGILIGLVGGYSFSRSRRRILIVRAAKLRRKR